MVSQTQRLIIYYVALYVLLNKIIKLGEFLIILHSISVHPYFLKYQSKYRYTFVLIFDSLPARWT